MSSADQITFPCPQCHQPVQADTWQAIDLAKQPDLRQQVLQGQLQHLHCPHCQTLALPFAVHDPVGQQVIFYIPANLPLPPEMIPQIQGHLGNALMLVMEGSPPEYIQNPTLCRDAEELKTLLRERSSEVSPKPETDELIKFSRMLERLTPDQCQSLMAIMQTATDEESFTRVLSKHPDLLAALQSVGQEFADETIPSDLREILNELSQPARIPDMPRRVQLCRKALNLLSREQNPKLWATLQNELGNSLTQNPLGDRAENIERAVAAYQQALEVRTREVMPIEWAGTMMNLANAYFYRIHGDRAENLEMAIAAYQQALEVTTREALPVEWAEIMQNLGSAYLYRIRGERAENLEMAIAAYQQALEVTTWEAMPIEWAGTMMNLANAYAERIRGERAENLDQAIVAYQQALEVRTREVMPIEWAGTMMNLANAYRDRIHGERAENLDQAIAAYQQTLEVMTRETLPVEWAIAMMNLANAYRERIRGERAENLEAAIDAYKQALKVLTRNAMPVDWAMTMTNLANTYLYRIHGERAENLETAITACQQALEVRTREAMPIEWAKAMTNLANAYLYRIHGERAENLETAITACQQALEVMTRESMPIEWAATMHSLAVAYTARIRGERAENVEQAIVAYQQALEVRTWKAMPIEWAETMNNLGAAYFYRIHEERAKNIETAIDMYQQVLEVMTRGAMPIKWAQTLHNLGAAYVARIRGERAENLEMAITACQQALEVMTREAMPIEWATTMDNLANAYADRIHGERSENLEAAIKAYQQALTIWTTDQFPDDYRRVQRNLGDLHFGEQNWKVAHDAFANAIEAGKILLETAYTETGRQAEVGQTSRLYAQAAYCLLRLGQSGKALHQLEQGKTRLLTQTLVLGEANLAMLSQDQQKSIMTARETIRTLEAEMRLLPMTPAHRDDRKLAELLRQTRLELRQAIDAIREQHPEFMPTGLDLPEMLALIPEGGALVALVVTSQGSAVFVVPHSVKTVGAEHVFPLDSLTENTLNTLLIGTKENPGWLNVYINWHNEGDLEQWHLAMETFTSQLWEVLMKDVFQHLQEKLHLKTGAPVLLMPQGGLGLLPLHAAWREVDGKKRAFLDDYQVTYIPSAYALSVSQQRVQEQHRHQRSLCAVVNPTKDLLYTPAEGEAIRDLFDSEHTRYLSEDEATVDAVMQAVSGQSYVHFSCHGFYDWEEAMRSGLVLAEGKPLTLSDIIATLDLSTARLITLSACETGMTEFQQTPDEYIGLPAGFLQAGAPGVISTLWAVNDLSTMLLMERFYQNHVQQEMDIPEALRQAQLWLRDVTANELRERFSAERRKLLAQIRMPAHIVTDQFRRFDKMPPDKRPFEYPFYWAAFTFSGA